MALPALLIGAAGWYVHRVVGAPEVVLGLVVRGRRGCAVAGGAMMANDLPLRLSLRADMSVCELARQASARTRGLLAHERYRYGDLYRDSKLAQSGCSARKSAFCRTMTSCASGDARSPHGRI
ncbi:hypothetical protein [Nonomuraea aridisoli]|uniref:Condensation domain-containing protein n=1 Tax=Nonomuraea aridisoli TaxID=2070368 RepID=A0A2W2ELS7_9ACTN|nr:hypothetical protein [Nonomuraea aridisoli]PZG17709.1 hypothetical protein C1J01_17195 [Nonomuraea aridisoli]